MSTSESFRLLSNQLKYYLVSRRHFVWKCLIVIVLVASLFILLTGFLNPIEDHHSFRQTQVAITIYWMITEDLFSYLVPVTLPPWNVPRELPLYQFIVAVLCKLFNLQIEPCARFVSITFFYLSSFYLYKVTKLIFYSLLTARFTVIVFLLSPIYLFWSRACMIESLALFLGLCFMYNAMILVKKSKYNITALTILGILAALVKVTTFYPIILFVFLYCLFNKAELLKNKKNLAVISSIFIACALWYLHCKSVREFDWLFNESGQEGINWISGINERIFELNFFKVIWWEITSLVLPSAFFLLPFAFLGLRGNRCILLAFSFIITILCFANLYYQHDYYIYGSGFIVIMLFSYCVISLLKKYTRLRFVYPILLLYSLFSIIDYTIVDNGYYKFQNNSKNKYEKYFKLVDRLTNSSDIGLICGSFCNPTLPYNLQRKIVTIGDYRGYILPFKQLLHRINNHCDEYRNPITFALLPDESGYDELSESLINQFDFQYKFKVGDHFLFVK